MTGGLRIYNESFGNSFRHGAKLYIYSMGHLDELFYWFFEMSSYINQDIHFPTKKVQLKLSDVTKSQS